MVSSTSCVGSAIRCVASATTPRRVSSGSGHVAEDTPVRGELCVDTDIPEESTESLELDARLRIDSSEELDLSSSCLSVVVALRNVSIVNLSAFLVINRSRKLIFSFTSYVNLHLSCLCILLK